jgi:hypothetical protein
MLSRSAWDGRPISYCSAKRLQVRVGGWVWVRVGAVCVWQQGGSESVPRGCMAHSTMHTACM